MAVSKYVSAFKLSAKHDFIELQSLQ